jgi:hypothetical protein
MLKLIALISKKPEISDHDFQIYYENTHAPLIRSIFPMLLEYKRTFLPRSNMLSGDFTLEADKLENVISVITELGFENQNALDLFMELASKEDIVERIREDESNFLNSEKTIMYQLNE